MRSFLSHACGVIEVRPARVDDDAGLSRIDAATWTADVSPAPLPAADAPFFGPGTDVGDVLVAEIDGTVVGYAKLDQTIPAPSHQHVLALNGLAVDPAGRRRGVGRRLVEEAIAEASRRGARKLSLRVLAPNSAARQLYEVCGFNVEGVLREEFLLDGQYVDDVLMARPI
jgi:ribosomal protein S18 acetylase RimI-like enzyme